MRVVPLAELAEGRPIRVVIDEQPILLTLLDGEPHAIGDTCPHRGASLFDGIVRDGCVTCPAHFWRFSLRDGSKQGDGEIVVTTYPCTVEDGWVCVAVPPRTRQLSMREILLAHARTLQ
jgi:nitrite reductase/ring-hydroxylating ferredoxin subunit